MSQLEIDQVIVNADLTIKEKVKRMVHLLMVYYNITYQNAYHRAKSLVNVEWKVKEKKQRALYNYKKAKWILNLELQKPKGKMHLLNTSMIRIQNIERGELLI